MANAIITENLNVGIGSASWKPSTNTANWQYIQAYTDKISYNPGDTVTFFVSTASGGTTYTFTVYRLGYYQGLGARSLYTSGTLTGVAQGYWDGTTLNNCPTAIIDSTTHLTEAGWSSSTTWTVPNPSCAGVYYAKFTDQNGKTLGCTFIVKGNTGADYLYVYPSMTDQAYNAWGGHSLYTAITDDTKVSYNRPMYLSGGGVIFSYGIPFLQWIEQQGYNIDYCADIDVHVTPSMLKNYKVLLSGIHDEYWTKERRDGWEAALAAGVSCGFMAANTCYWQARLEAAHDATPNRTVVCYKVQTVAANLAKDPKYGVDNTRVSTLWRDAVLNRPENSMIGIMYSSFNNSGNTAWTTDASMDTTYNAGTGLVANTSYGSDLTGYEWDNTAPQGWSGSGGPSNLKIIGTSTPPGGGDTANTTFYRHTSGALVFASGSVGWTYALGSYRWTGSQSAPIPGMQTLTANIMGALKGPVFRGF